MKRILYILLISLVWSSCSDKDLEVTPGDMITDAAVWSTPANANLFLNDIYNSLTPGPWSSVFTNLPTEISNDPLDNYSDNAVSGPIAGIPSYQLFANGSYGPANPIFNNQWSRAYANIRKANLFILKVGESDFAEATKKSMIAQARFLRAYFYKQLIDLYGGVPLITEVLDRSSGEDISYPRSSYAESIEFLRSEFTAAAADLPLKVSGANLGRPTKGAALAFRGQAELYAGKFDLAAATNWEIMQLGAGYDLFPDYAGTFHSANENNVEVIFDIQYAPIVKGTSRDSYWGPTQVSDGIGWGAVNPTQNLIDQYEFLDGKTAEEGSALYDPANPYANREKRFYASIIYDGVNYRNGTIYTREGVPNNRNQIDLSGSGVSGRSGYYHRKMLDPAVVPGRQNLNERTGGTNVIVFRYAEVLLNYAEAKNEVSGPDQTVYDAVNAIRDRAGLPDLPTGLSQVEMREEIRHERRIELAFEGRRLFDLWRWRIAEQVFSSPLQGMRITGTDGNLNYNRISISGGKITFDPSKNYLFPIPQSAIDKNPKLEQNPGY